MTHPHLRLTIAAGGSAHDAETGEDRYAEAAIRALRPMAAELAVGGVRSPLGSSEGADGRLVGMITVDDVVEIVNAETSEDMLALGGVEPDSGLSDSVVETVRSRFSWLAVNLATAILASIVIAFFDQAIAKFVALAVLMPIVASMGGNAGTQTLTVAVRSLATRDLTPANAVRIIWREALVGGANGVLFAVILGALAGAWHYWSSGDAAASARLGGVLGAAIVVKLYPGVDPAQIFRLERGRG